MSNTTANFTLPDPQSPALSQACDCARLAGLAYLSATQITESLSATCEVHPFSRAGVSGFVAWNSAVTVISVAGTNEVCPLDKEEFHRVWQSLADTPEKRAEWEERFSEGGYERDSQAINAVLDTYGHPETFY